MRKEGLEAIKIIVWDHNRDLATHGEILFLKIRIFAVCLGLGLSLV
ncbi:MAG: hypothetical protein ACJ0BQ_01920 [Coraliomargaritaceae bacterium]